MVAVVVVAAGSDAVFPGTLLLCGSITLGCAAFQRLSYTELELYLAFVFDFCVFLVCLSFVALRFPRRAWKW